MAPSRCSVTASFHVRVCVKASSSISRRRSKRFAVRRTRPRKTPACVLVRRSSVSPVRIFAVSIATVSSRYAVAKSVRAIVDRVIDAARAVAIPLDRQVLHILPQQFAVDDQEGVRDPVGMAGVRLEARIHMVTAAQSYGQNLGKCCERAGITPAEMMFEPLCSADAALFPEERELGVALIDIGGGTTDIIVFHNGAVMHTAVLPIGGNHLTGDVAAGLRTPMSEAERLKIHYGIATNLVVGRDEMVQVPGVGGREPRLISRRLLGEIIEPRMEEIFAMSQRELLRSGVADSLASGVVLVGGTSLLEGTQELAERIFNLPVRRGLPINLKDMPEELMKPMYTTAAGLLMHAAAGRTSSNGLARFGRWGRLRSRVTDWVRDFF